MAKVLEGLYYSESHEYVRVEGDCGYIGITDYAQKALGNVVYVDMPDVDDEVSPVTGVVLEVNEALEDEPERINADAYENWIIKVSLNDKSELDDLMDAKAYSAFCEK